MIITIQVEKIDTSIKNELMLAYRMYNHYAAKYLTSVLLYDKEKYKKWAREELNKIVFIESNYNINFQEVNNHEK